MAKKKARSRAPAREAKQDATSGSAARAGNQPALPAVAAGGADRSTDRALPGQSPDRIAYARYRVWDLPTRLCHWGLVIGLFAQFASGLFGLLPMASHLWLGYALLVVVLFRIVWGFVGSESARFRHFLHGPRSVLAYLRLLATARATRWPGHNPLGGWSSLVLLGLTLLQSLTGLYALRRGELEGPLLRTVSRSTAQLLDDLHGMLHWPLLLFVLVHIGAGFYYLLRKRENRIGPIFGAGRLELAADPHLRGVAAWRAPVVLAVAVAVVVAIAAKAP